MSASLTDLRRALPTIRRMTTSLPKAGAVHQALYWALLVEEDLTDTKTKLVTPAKGSRMFVLPRPRW
jgi:hypothetical protein